MPGNEKWALGQGAEPSGLLDSVVPADVEQLVELRARRRRRWAGAPAEPLPPGGDIWELKVLAGGPLDEIGATTVSRAAVAALGAARRGVGYLSFGLEVDLPVPRGGSDGPPDRAAWRLVEHLHDGLRSLVQERTGLAVPADHDRRAVVGHRLRVKEDKPGSSRVDAFTETAVLIEADDEGDVDLAAVLDGASVLPGRVWAGYGVLLLVQQDFAERSPAPERGVSPAPVIETAFWDAAAEALTTTAAAVGLPAWPLLDAWLHCLTAERGSAGNRFGLRWGLPR